MNEFCPVDDDLVDEVCRRASTTRGEVTEVVTAEVDQIAPLATPDERHRLIDTAVARLDGLDRLQRFLDDPEVDEIMVNRGEEVWIERHGTLIPVGPISPATLTAVVERILAPLGKRLDRTAPIVDARLADGSRVCAVVEPVAVDGPTLSIRRHRSTRIPLRSFTTGATHALLTQLVDARCNVLIAGATSTGKTTLLTALLSLASPDERLVVLEDTTEIALPHHHLVRLETRPAIPDQPQAIVLADLVQTALRLRPDRLILGEFRGDEVRAVIEALNTGHRGCLATCHANSSVDALRRTETLVMRSAPTWPLEAIRRQITRSLDVVVFLRRSGDGTRLVDEVVEVIESDGPPHVRPLISDGDVVGELTRERR